MKETTHNDLDFSFGKHSSDDISEIYNTYLDFIYKIEKLPSDVKSKVNIFGQHKNFDELSRFFSSYCQESNASQKLFRKGNSVNDELINIWLSLINRKEQLIKSISPIPEYLGLSKPFAESLVKKSIDVNFINEIPRLLLEKGIILIYENAIPRAKVDGVVYINNEGNPVVGLSFRYSRVDNFWFTLMHELSHIILHFDELYNTIIDDFDDISRGDTLIEDQADRLALELMIPRRHWRNSLVRSYSSESNVIDFAAEMNIHPAIVAGRVRKEQNNYKVLNRLICGTDTREIAF